jgi:hypothetical protein
VLHDQVNAVTILVPLLLIAAGVCALSHTHRAQHGWLPVKCNAGNAHAGHASTLQSYRMPPTHSQLRLWGFELCRVCMQSCLSMWMRASQPTLFGQLCYRCKQTACLLLELLQFLQLLLWLWTGRWPTHQQKQEQQQVHSGLLGLAAVTDQGHAANCAACHPVRCCTGSVPATNVLMLHLGHVLVPPYCGRSACFSKPSCAAHCCCCCDRRHRNSHSSEVNAGRGL